MPRPIQATVHRNALQHNLEKVRNSAPDARVWAVVKANAYGHGIVHVFDSLRAADGFALLDLAEAELLRQLGWRGPIMLLEGVFEPRDLELCSRLNLWHVVHCDEQIDMLAAHKTHQGHRVFLKMNSGMNRLGFAPPRYRSAWARLNALPQVDEISLITHFSDADTPKGISEQERVFMDLTHDLPGERSTANSATILRHQTTCRIKSDWVRAGIMLYGSAPDFPEHSPAQWDLQPTMTLRTRLIGVQQVRQGDTVGYGSTFEAPQDMLIGIAACGYADGYPRHCPTGTPVLVDGVRTHLVGRVSMDMLAVNLQPLQDKIQHHAWNPWGAEVTLWGHSAQGTTLWIDEVAHAARTISYELMCAIAPRVQVVCPAECSADASTL